MSYRVLIVDDEPMIRCGLSACIDWDNEGFFLVGEAINGKVALDHYLTKNIDILITDIKMPLIDGLELTRQWQQYQSNIKVILISSYSDFEYAREAVQLGVVADYLLKPTMEPEDLLSILQKCKSALDEEALKEQENSFYYKEAEKNKYNQLEMKMKRILNGGSVQADELPEWMREPLVLAVWEQDNPSNDSLESLLQMETAKEKLLTWFTKGVAFVTGENQLVTLFPNDSGKACIDIKKYRQTLSSEYNLCFTTGISPSFHHVNSIVDAYRWSSASLLQSFYEGRGKCFIGKIDSNNHLQKPSLSTSETKWSDLRVRFSKEFALSNKENSQQILEEYFSLWKNDKKPREEILTETRHLLTMMWSRKQKLKTEEMMKEILDKLEGLNRTETLEDLVVYIRSEFSMIWDNQMFSVIPEDSKGAHVIQLALSYIQENFRKELSLKEVADHVYMSKNYFSEQFKHFTGLNFIDFVISLRIHHAKQLLGDTALRIQDVGTKSGFQSPKYFLKLFKREVACTPAEYRQKHYNESLKSGVNV
jgi:two-component system response regulator YesN